MPICPTVSDVPESIRIAIEGLWSLSMASEEHIYASTSFDELENTCQSVYLGLEDSRLVKPPSIKVSPGVLSRALRNFFRWNGAPWFGDQAPNAGKTAANLHRSFLRRSICRTYLVPLDRLSLEEGSSGSKREVTSVHFGPNEITRLHRKDLSRRVPVEALARFGPKYQFPTEELDGFCWLATSESEQAGLLEKRTWLNILNTTKAGVGSVELFRSTYPPLVENALFVLLLILAKDPQDIPWQPFRIPWVFSFTDDLFSDPIAPPNASELTRSIVGDENDYILVPDESEFFELEDQRREALQNRWDDLETFVAKMDTDDANFHPLTRYFFVKALSDRGIDQIISDLSCLEATLQLKCDRSRKRLNQRYERLVANKDASEWLKAAYQFRDNYLHSLANPRQRLTWTNLSRD